MKQILSIKGHELNLACFYGAPQGSVLDPLLLLISKNLKWKLHVNDIVIKLNRKNHTHVKKVRHTSQFPFGIY